MYHRCNMAPRALLQRCALSAEHGPYEQGRRTITKTSGDDDENFRPDQIFRRIQFGPTRFSDESDLARPDFRRILFGPTRFSDKSDLTRPDFPTNPIWPDKIFRRI